MLISNSFENFVGFQISFLIFSFISSNKNTYQGNSSLSYTIQKSYLKNTIQKYKKVKTTGMAGSQK